jgi:hypothetical protein
MATATAKKMVVLKAIL